MAPGAEVIVKLPDFPNTVDLGRLLVNQLNESAGLSGVGVLDSLVSDSLLLGRPIEFVHWRKLDLFKKDIKRAFKLSSQGKLTLKTQERYFSKSLISLTSLESSLAVTE
jgi:hypothetical protein